MASLVIKGDVALMQMTQDLLSTGAIGKAIFRKGVRAGAKIIATRIKATFPRKSGKAAGSVKVKAMKRSRARIGVRVALFAESAAGFPYPMGLERGTKKQKKGSRIRKERSPDKYADLTWHVEPQHNVEKAFKDVSGQAMQAIEKTWIEGIEKASVK